MTSSYPRYEYWIPFHDKCRFFRYAYSHFIDKLVVKPSYIYTLGFPIWAVELQTHNENKETDWGSKAFYFETAPWSAMNIHMSRCNQILTHWNRDRMAAISQTTLSNAFSVMKMCGFQLRFHWILFPMVQLTIFHHWIREWIGAEQATSH